MGETLAMDSDEFSVIPEWEKRSDSQKLSFDLRRHSVSYTHVTTHTQ